MKRFCFLVVACFLLMQLHTPLHAQETEDEKEEIRSISAERRELLLYGIDSQVIELVGKLIEEKNDILAGEVLATFKLTLNPKVKSKILEYFTEIDFAGARAEALEIIDTPEESSELVIGAIRYLTEEPTAELAEHFLTLVNAENQEIARAAIKGIGLTENAESAEVLLGLLDDSDYPADLKSEIIIALGDLKNPVAVTRLLEILEDENEDVTWRRYACASLGKIADPTALPVIEKVLYDDDAMLRSYAVGSLNFFSDERVVDLLAAALKDSFWRVRVSAAKSLGALGNPEAVPILVFKAERDPEMNVRNEAVRALGEIANSEALEALREIYGSDHSPHVLRVTSAEILAEKDLAKSLDLFKSVIDKHWGKDTTRILEKTALILSRTESRTESASLESFYARFIESGELVIMIYGIRGIAKNKLSSLSSTVEELSGEGNHRTIRKEALAALEQLE